jgi:hypothetical protein
VDFWYHACRTDGEYNSEILDLPFFERSLPHPSNRKKSVGLLLHRVSYMVDVGCFREGGMMMMSFICSCRNKNERKAIYTKATSHHTRLFRGPSTNDMKK